MGKAGQHGGAEHLGGLIQARQRSNWVARPGLLSMLLTKVSER